QARVILTVRDPERWYDSSRATIFRMHQRVERSAWARALLALVGLAIPPLRDGYDIVNDIVWDETFGGRFTDREHALWVFRQHAPQVQTAIPPDRLLVFDVAEGWDPLCRFLGVPVPEGEPFPHANDRASFQRRIHGEAASHILRLGGATVAGAVGVSALTWLAWRLLRT
ncbi:MAG: Sulfotransferase family, partial [Thermomicrobiales bacterium]|nr:Sulfotransferase family [Thermomicrobiales bacterium]